MSFAEGWGAAWASCHKGTLSANIDNINIDIANTDNINIDIAILISISLVFSVFLLKLWWEWGAAWASCHKGTLSANIDIANNGCEHRALRNLPGVFNILYFYNIL